MEHIDLRSLDLNLLVALDRLLAHQGVGGAARDLGLSQPATSRALQRLREVLRDPLLVRVGRKMVPTARARALEGPTRDALAAVAKVFAPPEDFDPATARGTLSIALGDETQVSFADAIVAALHAVAPGIDVRIRPLRAETLEEGRRGEVDLALAPDLSALPASAGAVDFSELVARPLYVRRFVVLRSARFPAALALDAYCAADHVIVSFDGGGRGFVDDLLQGLGRTRRVAASVTSFLGVVALVAGTDLVATVPDDAVAASGAAVVAHPAPFPLPELPMMLLWHPRHTSSPRHRFLRERVADAILGRVAERGAAR